MQIINVKATPLSRGRCIELTWENPTDAEFKEVAIHRRTDVFGYDPASPFSVEIYRGTGTKAIDFNIMEQAVISEEDLPEFSEQEPEDQAKWLVGERLYYYTFYAVDVDDNHYATEASTVAMAPTAHYGLGRWLYKQVPLVYVQTDTNKALKRYCDLIGEQMDHTYSLIKMLRTLNNPAKVNPKYLKHLAQTLGWNLDRTLSTFHQRRAIQNAIRIYRYAGTKKGLDALVKMHSGFPTTSGVVESFGKIMRTPSYGITLEADMLYIDCVTPDFRDVGDGGMDFDLIGTANDPLYYTWDFSAVAKAAANKYIAYVEKTIPLTPEQEADLIQRLTQILSEFTPTGVVFEIQVY